MRPANTRASASAGMTPTSRKPAFAGAVVVMEAAIALKREIAEEFIGRSSLLKASAASCSARPGHVRYLLATAFVRASNCVLSTAISFSCLAIVLACSATCSCCFRNSLSSMAFTAS
jgi:hypothetical protein